MKYDEVYNNTLEFLKNNLPEGMELSDIDKYTKVSFYHPNTINDVFKSFVHSLQNSGQMKNVIQFEQRELIIKGIMLDFNPENVVNDLDYVKIYTKFYDNFKFKNKEKTNNLWDRYTKGIVDSAKFLSRFHDFKAFDDFVKSFESDEFSLAALPMILEKEIHNMGFALACDSLKELGYMKYPKPDRHLRDIFKGIGLSDGTAYGTYKQIMIMAKEVSKTPYEVDKTFYLISSGDYYLDKNVSAKNMKNDLIEYLNKNCTI